MKNAYYSVSFDEFCQFASQGNLVPLYREILADFETPVSAFSKINTGANAFLFESIEGGENWARYSFLGSHPSVMLWEENGEVVTQKGRKQHRVPLLENPLHHIQNTMAEYYPVIVPGLPRFVGGAVGYLGYDMVRSFEPVPSQAKPGINTPLFAFCITDTLLIFDNVAHTLKVVANAHITSTKKTHLRQIYRDAINRIELIIARLHKPSRRPAGSPRRTRLKFQSNMTPDDFKKIVLRTKEYIQAGDIIQGVMSQRWHTTIHTDPLEIYRALRVLNPSPYMFYLRIAGIELVGSSPEILVRCEEGHIVVRPIAGTRSRGQTPQADQALEQDLLSDHKELAEHVMLVDLGRNDVGRVAKTGTVKLERFKKVERYSHVMHIVSQIKGELDSQYTAYDVMKACFPAGTVSGAPKIRAMQIIEELEPTRRGPYAGAVGYFSFSGNMDTCINIRTVVVQGQKAYIQAGAGIVADSDPTREYEETRTKAGAMMRAIEMAEHGLA
ncbi:MAG: anthranilate synthase component I [Nitrospira sp.]|nr:anthranilate synthase component I [Nitrospira sp.]